MEPPEDSTLVRRAQAGDRGAFEGLIRAHARILWASVYGWVREPSWTEDVVQETFLRAWQSIGSLQDPGAFRGWLLTIARRLSWGQAETREREAPSLAASPVTGRPDEPRDPEEAREEVHRALARLPERYRVPVTLHFLNGLEYGAIERLTGLANGSLRGLVARGVAKLRAELAPWWRSRHEHS